MAPLKPLTQQQKTYAQEHHCFLVRNYEKVQKFREAFHMIAQSAKDDEKSVTKANAQTTNANNVSNPEEMILTALNTSRSMQTRTLKIAQDDPKITKLVKVAQILREIFSATIATSPKGVKMFKEMPSRKRNPDQFDRDFLILFQNNYRFYGHHSIEGKLALDL